MVKQSEKALLDSVKPAMGVKSGRGWWSVSQTHIPSGLLHLLQDNPLPLPPHQPPLCGKVLSALQDGLALGPSFPFAFTFSFFSRFTFSFSFSCFVFIFSFSACPPREEDTRQRVRTRPAAPGPRTSHSSPRSNCRTDTVHLENLCGALQTDLRAELSSVVECLSSMHNVPWENKITLGTCIRVHTFNFFLVSFCFKLLVSCFLLFLACKPQGKSFLLK